MSHWAFIFIGSNINREENYLRALEQLQALGVITAVSSIYDTAALGGATNTPRYYNGAVLLETELSPHELHNAFRAIEGELGRVRTGDPNEPRTIDLDLVLYDHAVIYDTELHIPDPHIWERGFMAAALAELEPSYIVPTVGSTLAALAERTGGKNELKNEAMTKKVRKEVFAHHTEGAKDG